MVIGLDAANEAKTTEAVFWIAGTKLSCKVADALAIMTNRHLGDETLMNFASVTKLRGMPRSQDYLANYMNGSGATRTFKLSDLLRDKGVRVVVSRHFAKPITLKQDVIIIRQKDYSDPDWKNALGTYFIYYIDVGTQRDIFNREARCVLAWGEDTYLWHPDDEKRFTQCIHQAAERLRVSMSPKGIKAANFKMLTPYATLNTETLSCSPARSGPDAMVHATNRVLRHQPAPMCRGQ